MEPSPAKRPDLARLYSIVESTVGDLARRLAKDDCGLAHDIVQGTALKLRNEWPRPPDKPLAPWLVRVAKNVFIDLYRRDKRKRELPEKYHKSQILERPEDTTLAAILDREERDRVRTALTQLEVREWVVIHNLYFRKKDEQMKRKDIEAWLGVSHPTRKKYEKQAFEALRRLLGPEDSQ